MQTNETTIGKQQRLTDILIDRSIDAIIAINTGYNIIAWNNAATLMYHVPKKQAEGSPLFEVLPALETDNEFKAAIQQALNGYKSFLPATKQFAHRRHAENHFTPLHGNDGNIIGVMNIVHDVAHRIKAEQQLQHLNEELEKRYRQLQAATEELASFTYFTSNKIKEPIRHVYTGIEHMIKVEAGRLSDSGKASFRRIQSSLNRMDLLLDDMLRLSQISILEKAETVVNLDELIQEVAEAIKAKGINATININELCTIHGHKDYLYILFYNLLDNAIKFNNNAIPEITIACEKVLLNNELAQQPAAMEYYRISIKDNGIGFSNEDAGKIFNMFEKLHDKKYRGSGTGLTLARKIMHAHNGFITAESEAGQGATFNCFFPVENIN